MGQVRLTITSLNPRLQPIIINHLILLIIITIMLTTIIHHNPELPLIMLIIIEYLLLVLVNRIYLYHNLRLFRTIIRHNHRHPIKFLIPHHQITIIKILQNHRYLSLPLQVIWFLDPLLHRMGVKNSKNRKNLILLILQTKIIIILQAHNLIFITIIMEIITRHNRNQELHHQIRDHLQDK